MPDVALALISGLVGAVLVGGVEFYLRRREERAELRAAARLVLEELAAIAGALKLALSQPELLLQTLERERSDVNRDQLWRENRLALARLLHRDDEWLKVRIAYGFARLAGQAEQDVRVVQDAERSVREAIDLLERRSKPWPRR